MYMGDGLFVMFQTPSGTPFQSDNAMAVVGTRHNNLVTRLSPLPRRGATHIRVVSISLIFNHPDAIPRWRCLYE